MTDRTQKAKQAVSLRAVASAAFSSLLIGCAGGGSSTNVQVPTTPAVIPPTTPPAAPASASDFRTSEYNQSWALEAVHAADVYARGFTGAGVIIGVVDFNIDLAQPDIR